MIRRCQPGDHLQIARIYHGAIWQLASQDYTPEQLEAWAGRHPDLEWWAERCGHRKPLVDERNEELAGFIELDPDGHIGCTFVNPAYQGQGVMAGLMARVKQEAAKQGNTRLYAEVSITARQFFTRQGFRLIRENSATRNGVVLMNFLMECPLAIPE